MHNRVIGSGHNVYDDNCKGNKMLTISTQTAKLIAIGTKKHQDAIKTKKQAVDLLVAEGYKSFDFDLYDKTKKEFCDSVKAAIVLGFSLEARELLVKETKTLSDVEKGVKRYLVQQIGSEFNYYKKALVNREANPTSEKSEKANDLVMYFRFLKDALDRLPKLENAGFSIMDHKSALEGLLSDK